MCMCQQSGTTAVERTAKHFNIGSLAVKAASVDGVLAQKHTAWQSAEPNVDGSTLTVLPPRLVVDDGFGVVVGGSVVLRPDGALLRARAETVAGPSRLDVDVTITLVGLTGNDPTVKVEVGGQIDGEEFGPFSAVVHLRSGEELFFDGITRNSWQKCAKRCAGDTFDLPCVLACIPLVLLGGSPALVCLAGCGIDHTVRFVKCFNKCNRSA